MDGIEETDVNTKLLSTENDDEGTLSGHARVPVPPGLCFAFIIHFDTHLAATPRFPVPPMIR